MTTLRLIWILSRGAFHVALGFFIVAIVFRFVAVTRHAAFVRWWSARLLKICRVHLRVVPPAMEGTVHRDLAVAALRPAGIGAMLVLNHVSWLDIFIVHALRHAHFIAKDEIAHWPVAGYMTARSGAVFIERGKRHAVREANHRVATMLADGELVGMFPEGTTSDGNRLLPFHSNLIQPAIRAQAPVVVAGVRYRDRNGDPTPATLYTGDIDLMQSLMRIIRHGPVFAEFRLIDAIETKGLTRHAVAQKARELIAAAFAFADDDLEAAEDASTVIVVSACDGADEGADSGVSPASARRGTSPENVLDPRDELL